MPDLPSLADDPGIDELPHDGVPDERVESGHIPSSVQDGLHLAGDVREHLPEYPAGVVAVILQAALVVGVHAAPSVAVPEYGARCAFLAPPDGAEKYPPEPLRLEQLLYGGDLVDVAHAELLGTGLGAWVYGAVGVDAEPLRETRRVRAVGRRRVPEIVEV